MNQKIAFIFPGQGAQFPGMGKEVFEHFSLARETLEEAEDRLSRPLRKLMFDGPEEVLTKTSNSQIAIYVMSMALLRVLQQQVPELQVSHCGGLSLGEYTAATAAGVLSYEEALPLVQLRANLMHDACEKYPGTMAVVMGLPAEEVEQMVQELDLPHDLWAANFNCPGQVVISGTRKGIEAGTAAAKEKGARRVLPLAVHGAFHSGLMLEAEEELGKAIAQAAMAPPALPLVMNVPGDFVDDLDLVRRNLKRQVTSPVRWEQGVRNMEKEGVDLYLEIGPGRTLAGMNKKIGVVGSTRNFQSCDDLKSLETTISGVIR